MTIGDLVLITGLQLLSVYNDIRIVIPNFIAKKATELNGKSGIVRARTVGRNKEPRSNSDTTNFLSPHVYRNGIKK